MVSLRRLLLRLLEEAAHLTPAAATSVPPVWVAQTGAHIVDHALIA